MYRNVNLSPKNSGISRMRPGNLVSIINQKTDPFSSALSQNVRNFPDVIFFCVFPRLLLLQSKSLRPLLPGEFVGRSSETQREMRKQRILSDTANEPVHPQNQPRKRKNRPEVRSVENVQNGRPFWGFPELFSSPQNDEIFESLKMGYFIISKNSLRDSQKFAQPQNRVCISQKRSQKDSNLDSNLRPLLAA